MVKPQPPFFALEGNDIMMFLDLARPTWYLESPDVERGVYRFFDSRGTEYALSAKSGSVQVGGAIGADPTYLAEHMRYYLKFLPPRRRSRDDSEIDRMVLSELVQEFRLIQSG